MELLFVMVIGASIGGILRYLLPGRDAYGILLLPAIGSAVSGAVWAALTWVGLTFDGGWIWVASLAAGAIASALVALWLPKARERGDAALYERLSRP